MVFPKIEKTREGIRPIIRIESYDIIQQEYVSDNQANQKFHSGSNGTRDIDMGKCCMVWDNDLGCGGGFYAG